ncbi:hypothetical protein [Streptomyces subrutilus]|uniref:hypothetical protein n=1 Tax=Streptomyces subrutilus TaxID=36818 RepID=UPI002E0DDEED|nr:hypothetical protein OG479_35115 [Streptomyces subrutilus]
MGRDAKRAKQARRDQRRRDCGAPAVTVHAVSNPAEAMAALFGPGPASDDWRQDVLGGKRLSLRPGPDGTLRINGHPVTPEMCEALQAERPHDAADFDYETTLAMGRNMPPGLEYCRPAP